MLGLRSAASGFAPCALGRASPNWAVSESPSRFALRPSRQGADTVEANEQLGLAVDLREYKQCAEVLFDLGLCSVRVISNNPLKLRALEEAGLRIVERVSIQVESTERAEGYLRTKKEKLGHLLDFNVS